jgi:L-serine dehydratase
MKYPSIFNDVIGPVMRGPSSSHCAASLRIGRLARDLMEEQIDEIRIEFDVNGSLATTHETQGTDMGLLGGLLGWEANDERLEASRRAVEEAGIKIDIKVGNYIASHPNTYRLTLKNSKEMHQMIALSTGGGMVEIVEIDGIPLSMAGDYFETLIFVNAKEKELLSFLKKHAEADEILLRQGGAVKIVQIKAQNFLSELVYRSLASKDEVVGIKEFSPVLPITSHRNARGPFITCEEMLQYNEGKNLDLWELAVIYESALGNISLDDVFKKMNALVRIMKKSIRHGMRGTEFKNRILGCQSISFKNQMAKGNLLDGGLLNQMILTITAVMEAKSSMGVIVAAPTAGSCGVLPGTCIGVAEKLGVSEDEMTKGMLAAGLIGVFLSAHATFAAEVGGCQAECGAASGMAAAALITLAKGDVHQAVDASSMALQNLFGMVCDPVANRVEVPCLGKNVLAASNALSCANMALANYDPVIPLDEVIAAMDKVGKSIPPELRCTAKGGLSVTNTSKDIEQRLHEKASYCQ